MGVFSKQTGLFRSKIEFPVRPVNIIVHNGRDANVFGLVLQPTEERGVESIRIYMLSDGMPWSALVGMGLMYDTSIDPVKLEKEMRDSLKGIDMIGHHLFIPGLSLSFYHFVHDIDYIVHSSPLLLNDPVMDKFICKNNSTVFPSDECWRNLSEQIVDSIVATEILLRQLTSYDGSFEGSDSVFSVLKGKLPHCNCFSSVLSHLGSVVQKVDAHCTYSIWRDMSTGCSVDMRSDWFPAALFHQQGLKCFDDGTPHMKHGNQAHTDVSDQIMQFKDVVFDPKRHSRFRYYTLGDLPVSYIIAIMLPWQEQKNPVFAAVVREFLEAVVRHPSYLKLGAPSSGSELSWNQIIKQQPPNPK